jgi:molybdate transport system substrate-binding protein
MLALASDDLADPHARGRAQPTSFRRRSVLVVLASCMLSALACSHANSLPTAAAENRLVVFAAASLRDAFMSLADSFKRSHPGVEVTFSFAGSQEIRTQIEQGASADVFASADQQHMQTLLQAGRVIAPVTFARNEPVIAVANDKRALVRTFADLPAATRLVVGVPEVPIGRYTLQILDRASHSLGADFRQRVEANIVSRELNVRQVLAKVSLGEADAGFVYRSDALSAQDRVGIVSIPSELNVIAAYPIALVAGAPHPLLARAWLDLVLSKTGQAALQHAGFIPPLQVAATP